MTRNWITFSVLVICFFAALTIPWVFWPLRVVFPGVFMFGLYSFLAVGLAVDLAEALLAICWRTSSVRASPGPIPRHDCAVVMTVCNDACEACLTSLLELKRAGYDVYLLDDSTEPVFLPKSGAESVIHVRRASQRGAKAGSLNYWLARYGHMYRYFAVLDADSLMPVGSLDGLVLVAVRPENKRVAVFQSKVEPIQRGSTFFARVIGIGARSRMRVLDRVHAGLGCLLSFGHNQLLRIDALSQVGAFDETLSSEDTVLSLDLAARGWRTELVDVWSFDSDPADVSAYNRRTIRWARQTVELFRRPWHETPLRLKLLLCRHLLSYCQPSIAITLLCLSVWWSPASIAHAWSFLRHSLLFEPGFDVYGIALWPGFGLFLALLFLRTTIALLEKVPFRLLPLSWAFSAAPFLLLVTPLTLSMVRSAFGSAVRFVPTNAKDARLRDNAGFVWLIRALPALAALLFLGLAVVRRPGCLATGFNALWLAYLFLSPLSLLLLSVVGRDEGSRSLPEGKCKS